MRGPETRNTAGDEIIASEFLIVSPKVGQGVA